MVSENEPAKKPAFPADKRREELRHTLKTLGWWEINKTDLSKKFGVSRAQINRDIKIIMRNTAIRLEEISYGLNDSFLKGVKISHRIMINPEKPDEVRLKAFRTLAFAIEKYTEFLEHHGFKPPVVEKSEVQINFQMQIQRAKKELIEILYGVQHESQKSYGPSAVVGEAKLLANGDSAGSSSESDEVQDADVGSS